MAALEDELLDEPMAASAEGLMPIVHITAVIKTAIAERMGDLAFARLLPLAFLCFETLLTRTA